MKDEDYSSSGDSPMNDSDNLLDANTVRAIAPSPLQTFPFQNTEMSFSAQQLANYYGMLNASSPQPTTTPIVTSKRMTVMIGNKQKSLKIRRIIKDSTITVEDWLYDFVSKELQVFQLRDFLLNRNDASATGPLILSLGPNRSLLIDGPPVNDGPNKKKRKNPLGAKYLRVELIVSNGKTLLSPRDPLFDLIDANEHVQLLVAGEGNWRSPVAQISSAPEAIKKRKVEGGSASSTKEAVTKTSAQENDPESTKKNPKKRTVTKTQPKEKATSAVKAPPKSNKTKKAAQIPEKTKKEAPAKPKEGPISPTASGPKRKTKDTSTPANEITAKSPKRTKAIPATKTAPVTSPKRKATKGPEAVSTVTNPNFGEHDVLLGENQMNHVGNKKYLEYIESKLKDYANESKRIGIAKIIEAIFRFHKREGNSWKEVPRDEMLGKILEDADQQFQKRSHGKESTPKKKLVTKSNTTKEKSQPSTPTKQGLSQTNLKKTKALTKEAESSTSRGDEQKKSEKQKTMTSTTTVDPPVATIEIGALSDETPNGEDHESSDGPRAQKTSHLMTSEQNNNHCGTHRKESLGKTPSQGKPGNLSSSKNEGTLKDRFDDDDDGDNEDNDNEDDDASRNSSSSSSASSSSVSSSSVSSSSVSSSSSSVSSDPPVLQLEGKVKSPKQNPKLNPDANSTNRRSVKRKPLLDPSTPFLFP